MLYPQQELRCAAIDWQGCFGAFNDILYHKSTASITKFTINRLQVRNALPSAYGAKDDQRAGRCPL